MGIAGFTSKEGTVYVIFWVRSCNPPRREVGVEAHLAADLRMEPIPDEAITAHLCFFFA